MLNQCCVLPLGLGLLSSLLPVRSLCAQAIEVSSVNVRGRFDSISQCPGREHDPDPLVILHTDMTPVAANSQAVTDNGACLARGTTQASVTFYQLGNGALQVSGSGTVSTFGSIHTGQPEGAFAAGAASEELTVEVEIRVTRWTQLSFAGTLSIGTVTAVGSPDASSARMSQWWELIDRGGRQVVVRSIELGSEDQESTRQDINYSTILAGPGLYTLRIGATGRAAGDLHNAGATGWTCAGTYGVAISANAGCVADYDQNLVLDSRDFFEFMNAFFLEAADFNQDAVVDTRDLFDFLAAFLEGCE
jgi:hypothetical protein